MRALFCFLFGFLFAFSPITGIPALLAGLLFVRIGTWGELLLSLAGFAVGSVGGVWLWGESWIFEALKWGYREQGVWGFIIGPVVIFLLAIPLAVLISRRKGMVRTFNSK